MKLSKNKKIIRHILLIIGVIFTITPFLWMILTSFKTLSESTMVPPKIFPESLIVENYGEAFRTMNFLTLYKNNTKIRFA